MGWDREEITIKNANNSKNAFHDENVKVNLIFIEDLDENTSEIFFFSEKSVWHRYIA